MSSISEDVRQIREAIYGRDVREAIADGIEQCYTDVSGGVTKANTAANAANTAAARAEAAAASAEEIPGTASLEDINHLKSALSQYDTADYLHPAKVGALQNDAYIDSADGVIKHESLWKATKDYVPIPQNACVAIGHFDASEYDAKWNALYDENYNYVSSLIITEGRVSSIPQNARYYRVSYRSSDYSEEDVAIQFFTHDQLKDLIYSTIAFQGRWDTFDLYSNPIVITFSLNAQNNLGFFANKTSTYAYFNTLKYGSENNGKYTFTIPAYSALVIDLLDTYNRVYQVNVKTAEQISQTDVILLYCPGNYNQHYTTGYIAEYERYVLLKSLEDRSHIGLGNNDAIMRSICRFGAAYGLPESEAAIKACHNAGFNIVRVNLQFTSDNIPVLWHDQYLNQYSENVYTSNGDPVPHSAGNEVYIQNTSFADLNQYRYGRNDAPIGIPTAEAALSICRKLGMELYFEGKMEYTSEQISKIYSLIGKYGMEYKTSIAACTLENAVVIATNAPLLRIGLQESSLTDDVKTTYRELSQISKKLFWWGWSTFTLTADVVDFITELGIQYECGDFSSYSAIDNYLSSPYAYCCTGMELQGTISPLVGQYIANKALTS